MPVAPPDGNARHLRSRQRGKKMNLEKKHIIGAIAVVLAALIGAAATIIAVLIPKEDKMTIYLKDAASGDNISGEIFIDDDKNPTPVNETTGTTVPLKKGSHTIKATSEGYRSDVIKIDRVSKNREIKLEKIPEPPPLPLPPGIPLSFVGWEPWSAEITLSAKDNEVIVNGAMDDSAGFYHNGLPASLRGKTLILFFSNTQASTFSRDRMVKLAYNRNDVLLRPDNESLLNGEYIPARDTPPGLGIEFPIPDNFDGKLNFVFYQARLKDLKITAYYR
jgi:hypothetical protein